MKYLRFVKIEHTLFSLPIVFSGTFLALSLGQISSSIPWTQILWILLAVLGARSAGFGMNRIIDKDWDAMNPRTKDREIPSQKISVRSAWIFVFVFSLLLLCAAGQLSKTCLYLSPIPLVLFLIYPFLKRKTIWSHLGLGVAWGIAPVGGWLAVSPEMSPLSDLKPVILLALFCVFWVAGFDIVYALLDEDFDRQNGLYSMPAVMGRKNALRVSRIFHFIAILFLGTLVEVYLKHPFSYLFLAVAGMLLILSHWNVATKPLTPSVIDFAFFKVNAVLGFIIFLLVLL